MNLFFQLYLKVLKYGIAILFPLFTLNDKKPINDNILING